MSDLLKAAQQASKAPLVNRQIGTPATASSPTTDKETWGSRHTRKTLHLRTDLIEPARGEASKQGMSLSAFVNQSLEQALHKL